MSEGLQEEGQEEEEGGGVERQKLQLRVESLLRPSKMRDLKGYKQITRSSLGMDIEIKEWAVEGRKHNFII